MGKHKDVHLYIGQWTTLGHSALDAPVEIRGVSGFDCTDLLLGPLSAASPASAIEAMAAAFKSYPAGTAWIIATGMLTNVEICSELIPNSWPTSRALSHISGMVGAELSGAPLCKPNGSQDSTGNWT
jgi:inosine-uridine nucleoside N-ribohydrolase